MLITEQIVFRLLVSSQSNLFAIKWQVRPVLAIAGNRLIVTLLVYILKSLVFPPEIPYAVCTQFCSEIMSVFFLSNIYTQLVYVRHSNYANVSRNRYRAPLPSTSANSQLSLACLKTHFVDPHGGSFSRSMWISLTIYAIDRRRDETARTLTQRTLRDAAAVTSTPVNHGR